MFKTIITITHKPAEADPLFPEMTDSGMGAINIVDENGDGVVFPTEIHNALLKWAGYDE